MRKHSLFMVGSSVLCSLWGCASILGISDGKPYPDGDGAADVTVDNRPIEMIPDVNVEANYANCDGLPRALADGGVFASPTGDDNAQCSQQQPCSFLAAQAMAAQRGATMYLAPGVYKAGIEVSSGTLVIEGGWSVDDAGAWKPACDQNLAKVVGDVPVGSGSAVAHVSGGANLVLRLVSLENGTDPLPAGSSRYGVFFEGANLALEGAAIRTRPGEVGAAGGKGSGYGNENCSEGMGGKGNDGVVGAVGSWGTLTVSGYVPIQAGNGQFGDPGGGGGAGKPGGNALCTTCSATMFGLDAGMVDDDGGIIKFDAGSCATTQSTFEAGAGGPGCGGSGGGGGLGGAGGGASIGLYIAGLGKVVLRNGALVAAGQGGNGGAGGSGETGLVGRVGNPGPPLFMQESFCMSNSCTQGGSCSAEGGAGGSPGGQGGMGGQGGGGAGGPSYTLVFQQGAVVSGVDASTVAFSNEGAGGAPNGSKGDRGVERSY